MKALAGDVALCVLGVVLAMQGGALPVALAGALAALACAGALFVWARPARAAWHFDALALWLGSAAGHVGAQVQQASPVLVACAGAALLVLMLSGSRSMRGDDAERAASMSVALAVAVALLLCLALMQAALAPGLLSGAGAGPLWAALSFACVALAVSGAARERVRPRATLVALALVATFVVAAVAPARQAPLEPPTRKPFTRAPLAERR